MLELSDAEILKEILDDGDSEALELNEIEADILSDIEALSDKLTLADGL